MPHRRILGTELVLPDGELVKMGSLANGDDPFWGDGPGPDLRGLLRGFTGLRGCLGIVTKMAIKTLPFQPEPLVPTGISPNTGLALPQNRVKWINYQVPSKAAQVKAMFEVGKAEVAGAITKVPLFWRAINKAESKEEFWQLWGKENEDTIKNFFIVRVLLIGYTSEEQMQYDENVLNDIMAECGAMPRATKTPRRVVDQECRLRRDVAHVRFLRLRRLHHRVAFPGYGPRRVAMQTRRRNIRRPLCRITAIRAGSRASSAATRGIPSSSYTGIRTRIPPVSTISISRHQR